MGTGEWLRTWRRIVFRWRRAQLERDLAEELDFHRSLKHRQKTATGLSAEAAAGLTSKEMGNITLAKEESRDMWSLFALERLWQDLRFALRTFGSNPAFTTVAMVSLAIGIGGNAAVFSLVDTLLIRPLPYSEPDRLVCISFQIPSRIAGRLWACLSASQSRRRSLPRSGSMGSCPIPSLRERCAHGDRGHERQRGTADSEAMFESRRCGDRGGHRRPIVLTRFLSSLLYGATATDPLTFSSVSALLLGVTAAASCVPAWRAAQIDPTKSLRAE